MVNLFENFARHGGRLNDASNAFPNAPRPWLDLSTGINPRPWPMQTVSVSAFTQLPDPSQVLELEAAAAIMFGSKPQGVVAVPGAEAGLRALPDILRLRTVSIVSPTYGSHENAWRCSGADVTLIDHHAIGNERTDATVIVNPNNPNGQFLPPEAIKRIAREHADRDAWLIIDESFVDATPAQSVAAEAGDQLVVIRSFGKFFGLPGLRLGFILGKPDLVAGIRNRFGDWPLTSQTLATGIDAYRDTSWQNSTRQHLEVDASRLQRSLQAADFETVGSNALFQLVKSDRAQDWFHFLAERGILTRPFACNHTWLRFGLPNSDNWTRLELALEEGFKAIESYRSKQL